MFCKFLHDNSCSSYTNVYGPGTSFVKHIDPIVSYTGVRYIFALVLHILDIYGMIYYHFPSYLNLFIFQLLKMFVSFFIIKKAKLIKYAKV